MVATKGTNYRLPRMGLGMAALGRPGYINLDRSSVLGDGATRSIVTLQSQANLVMDALFALTTTNNLNDRPWMDCARSYGLAEQFVGDYLRTNLVQPQDVYVSSKWGYTYVADFRVSLPHGMAHEVKDHSTENFLKQLQETKKHLGEYLDLYQIHSATFQSGILTDDRAHRALADCKKELGWTMGLSVSGPTQDEVIREALKIHTEGERIFDSVQCTFNVLEQKPGPALEEAHNAGIDIIIKEGLANGRVLRNPILLDYSEKLSCHPDQLALGCILAQPFEPRVLSGAVTPEQLESNFRAMDLVPQLQDKHCVLLNEIMTACRIDSENYWIERSALEWN